MKLVIILRSDYSKESTSKNKDFRSTIFNRFSLGLNRKKRVVMKPMRKKLKIFTLQLPIYYVLE